MSQAKKKHMKRHPSDLELMLQMRFVDFNLSHYNSSDEWLGLNHFKNDLSMNQSAPRIPLLK